MKHNIILHFGGCIFVSGLCWYAVFYGGYNAMSEERFNSGVDNSSLF